MMPIEKIGILGGSFDPVHRAHIGISLAAKQALSLDRVLLMPARQPPHKLAAQLAGPRQRLDMLHLALEGIEGLEVCALEIERAGVSFTYQTLQSVRERYGQDAYLFFILGADMLCDLPNWRRVEAIAQNAVIACAYRPGVDIKDMQRTAQVLEREYGMRIEFISCEQSLISSSLIRRRIKSGQSVEGMMEPRVIAYIEKEGLYRF